MQSKSLKIDRYGPIFKMKEWDGKVHGTINLNDYEIAEQMKIANKEFNECHLKSKENS